MDLSKLLHDKKIVQYQSSQEEIDSKINIADANLRSCKYIVLINDPDVDDTAYKEAHNAILQAATALMYDSGYKVGDRGSHHFITQQFIEAEYAGVFEGDIINILGHARQTRNILQYNVSGAVSHSDVEYLISKADRFVATVKEILRKQDQVPPAVTGVSKGGGSSMDTSQ